VLAEIRRVLELESRAIAGLQKNLGPDYEEAVRLLFACLGKVVVTGVGKSGIIGQKIAATMVSTGTPAMFLHTADGMHGDVGIIQKDDVVLAIGKSGESDELNTILPVARKIGAKVISITAQPKSTLARHSDLVLHTLIEEEACPFNMAPTTSTTAALVVGDALAMALMKLRNFQPEEFAINHPGGQLGKRLLLMVGDIMRSGENNPVILISADTKTMLSEITSKRAGAVSVVDEEKRLVGLVTDYDIRKVLERGGDLFSSTVAEIMNPKPDFVFDDENAFAALEKMEKRDKPISLLPVLSRVQKVVGMIHLHDLIIRGL
jgi:arabinose-5-phosphate isomerase